MPAMASITTRRRSPDREFAVANLNAKDRIAEACVTPWAAQSAEGGTHKKQSSTMRSGLCSSRAREAIAALPRAPRSALPRVQGVNSRHSAGDSSRLRRGERWPHLYQDQRPSDWRWWKHRLGQPTISRDHSATLARFLELTRENLRDASI